MSIDREKLDALRRDRAALVQALQDAGAQLDGDRVKCGFHDDEHASGGVHEHEGVWSYTCHGCTWNGEKRTGDLIDVVRRARGLGFREALAALGVNGNGHTDGGSAAPCHATAPGGVSGRGERAKGSEGAAQSKIDPAALAAENAKRLQGDPAALAELWTSRGIDRATAERLGVGIDSTGRYWTFGIADRPGGPVVGVKHHRADPAGDGTKCFWIPKGTPSRHVFPLSLEPPGAVWLVGGELKAAAIIAAGRPAVGITGGEGTELPDELVGLLKGRPVALAGDDDDVGRRWVQAAIEKLTAAGLDVRAVNLRLDRANGLKDIGDWLVSRVMDGKTPDEIAVELDEAYERADRWRLFTLSGIWGDSATWEPMYHVPTGLTALDVGLGGGLRVGGCHLLVGKSGKAKTTLTVQVALNAARAGIPVGFVSLEMSRRDVGHLVAASLGGVRRSSLDKGEVRGDPAERLRQTVQRWGELPLVVVDDGFWPGALTRTGFAHVVADGCRRFGWRLVCLDYLGLLAAEGDETEYHADVENSTALKRLARVHGFALVVVAALRKYGRKDADAATSLDDVLGAGRLAYDAFSVFDVNCEQAGGDPGTRPTGLVRVRPLKTRFSGLAAAGGELQFRWWPGIGRITDLETERTFDAGANQGGTA